MTDLTIRQYQKLVDEWIQTIGVRYYSELTNTAVLMEEVGEVARIMARVYGEQSFKKPDEAYDLADEMADVLFILICLANQTGVDLTAAIERYLVQPGEWLHQIARQCGVSVDALLDANPQITDPNYIWPGLELTIPSIDVTATTHFNLNFRPVPSVNSTPMDVIPAGTTVDVNGRNLAGDWLFVTYDGRQGWIAGWLTAVSGDLADVPPIPADDPVTFPPRDQEAIVIEEPGPGSLRDQPDCRSRRF
jgi:NTP pyrophosphatase (non-canonical NTP hydrolase)/phage tail protein X